MELIKLIPLVDGCDELLDNEAFMTVFMFGVKHSITAYKAILDYSQMISEISKEGESLYNLGTLETWNSVVSSLENLADKSGEYHLQMSMINYFLIANEIKEKDLFSDDQKYGRKEAKKILKAHPYSSVSEMEQEPEYPQQNTYMVEETKMDFLQINEGGGYEGEGV